jgi:F-type H+-transporting ATPase subunit b
MHFEFDATFWAAVAFVILMIGFFHLGVHKKVAEALDHRATRITAELDEARKLKEEAQALVAEYRAKRQSAVKEAEDIIANAKTEAERLAAETKTRMEDFVARRTRMAEAKIAQAEAQAVADVRAAAADAAVAAAAKVLSETVKGQTAETLLTQGIAEVRSKLN